MITDADTKIAAIWNIYFQRIFANSLEQAFPKYKVDVKVTFDPAWHSRMISDGGREF